MVGNGDLSLLLQAVAIRTTSTAWITGGDVTVNPEDNTKFDVSEVTIQIVDSTTDPLNPTIVIKTFPATVGNTVDLIATTPATFLAIDIDGNLIQQRNVFTPKQRRSIVSLADIIHLAGFIDSFIDLKLTIASNQVMDVDDLSYLFGAMNLEGNSYTPNGNNLKLDKSEGTTFFQSHNLQNDAENPNFYIEPEQIAPFFPRVGDDSEGNAKIFSISDEIDPNNYDDGSGTLQAVPADKYTIQRIYMSTAEGPIVMIYGQNLYDSQLTAINAREIEPYVEIKEAGPLLFRYYLVLRQGATDLSDSSDAVFIEASKFGYTGTGGNVAIQGIPSFKSYSFTSRGVLAGTYYSGGFYEFPATDANLTQAGTSIVHASVNIAHQAHASIVAGGAGVTDGSDLVLTVTGTSFTDAGVRTESDSEIIVADCTLSSTDDYYETTKKWIGQITFTLSSTAGTNFNFDFNYGLSKYEDFGNRNFNVSDFEVVGLAAAADTSFDLALLKHGITGWTYAATGFVPGNGDIVRLSTDLVTEKNLANGEAFAYKRSNIGVFIEGNDGEGLIIEITVGANNSVQIQDAHIGVEF